MTKQNILHGSHVLSNLTRLNSTRLYGGDIITSVRILKHLVFNRNRSRLSNFTKNDIEEFTSVSIVNFSFFENYCAFCGKLGFQIRLFANIINSPYSIQLYEVFTWGVLAEYISHSDNTRGRWLRHKPSFLTLESALYDPWRIRI